MIIGLTGPAGCGKDTVANILVQDHGFTKMSLADPIKHFCQEVFGWGHAALWGPSENRSKPDPAWDGLTPRHALQTLGTEWGRAMHPDVWVRLLFSQIGSDRNNVVIPDVRFNNEAEYILKHKGLVVKIMRPAAIGKEEWRNHASEQELDWLPISAELHNDRGVIELESRVKWLLEVFRP